MAFSLRLPDLWCNSAKRSSRVDTDHIFANNIRFISMAAIVAIHCLAWYGMPLHRPVPHWTRFAVQPFKFGTIAFFLVSGFLFGERRHAYSAFAYFRRRLRNVFLPWAVWLLIFCLLRVAADLLHGRLTEFSLVDWAYYLRNSGTEALLDTAFWFVPNLLIALAVLLLLRRWMDDLRLGAALGLVSLLYGVNIYGHWVPVQHSRAVFGFVFYLWLGVWAAQNVDTFQRWIRRIPTAALCGAAVALFAASLGETVFLSHIGSDDPSNTLRITNQLYSIAVTLCLFRIRHAVWPRFMDVRANTYGLYLTHMIALLPACTIVRETIVRLTLPEFWETAPGAVILSGSMFLLTYFGSLLLVRLMLLHPALRWTVGLPQKRAQMGAQIPVPA